MSDDDGQGNIFDSYPQDEPSLPRYHEDEPRDVTEEREKAIQRADRPPSQEWKREAHLAIERIARLMPEFNSEHVWDGPEGGEGNFFSNLRPPDNGSPDGDALGPAMRRARKAGFMERTNRTTTATKRPQRHNNPKRVWRSLIYEEIGVREPRRPLPDELLAIGRRVVTYDAVLREME